MTPSSMRAITRSRYGGPEVLSLQTVERPTPAADQVLIRVHGSSVTSGDWHVLTGKPYLMRLVYGLFTPKARLVGMDVAGRVEAVGAAVKGLKVGDEVYGEIHSGAAADYALGREDQLALKPTNLDFPSAAALPVAGSTALQALRDAGRLKPGQKVLIIGASGGVGTLAVQIARALGAEVSAVCSAASAELVRGLGAHHVIDYRTEDYTRGDRQYDLVLDLVGERSVSEVQRAILPQGVFVSSAGSLGDWIGPLARLFRILLGGLFTRQTLVSFLNRPNHEDLAALARLVEAGQVVPVIHRRYALEEVPEAYRAQGAGHARGRHVVTV